MDYSATQRGSVIQFFCEWNEIGTQQGVCHPGSVDVQITCTGVQKNISYHCNGTYTEPTCAYWDSSNNAWDSSTCTTTSFSSINTTCLCYNADTLLGGASSSWQSLDYTSVYATPFSSSSRVVRITPLSNADISVSDTVAIHWVIIIYLVY